MTLLTLWTVVTVAVVIAALVWLMDLVRADGYGHRCPPSRAHDLAGGLPNGPYSLTPPQ